MLNFFPKYFL
jgi:hypothetical protein